MRNLSLWAMYILLGGAMLLAGCGAGVNEGGVRGASKVSRYDVTCIAVLPAVPLVDPEGQRSEEVQKSLQTGAQVLDRLLQQELGDRQNVRFVDSRQLAGMEMEGGESAREMARMAGRRVNCDVVLESVILRFAERMGSKYTVEEPAAVAFDLRLIAVASGEILWSARFDEAQQSVLENLFELGKAKSRGFTWITAEELMREGLREKIRDSVYLQPEKTRVPEESYPTV